MTGQVGTGGLSLFIILVAAVALMGCRHDIAPDSASRGSSAAHAPAGVIKSDFGKTRGGQSIELYTLTNSNGVTVKIMTYGATVTEVDTPDRSGHLANITLGFDSLAEYQKASPYFGATVGRYANRIAKGKFTLDGQDYSLAINNGPNSLHGGKVGFDKVIWEAVPGLLRNASDVGVCVEFRHTSPDMDEGYPGVVHATVTYTLTSKNELRIDYSATTDKPTPINLTNHCYWNLSGFAAPTILDEIMMIDADRYTPVDDTQIPTGELRGVKGTRMDFRQPVAIGARIDQVEGGYDHNYVLNKKAPGQLSLAARAADPQTGRVMEVWTTEPGLQFYTGNFLDGKHTGKDGHVYGKHGGFCLEAQHFPNSPNEPSFPSTILKPGQTYTQTTIHEFYTK